MYKQPSGIALCYKPITTKSIVKEDEKEMIFAGFIFAAGPLKPGIFDTIEELKKLQVGFKIIAGIMRICRVNRQQYLHCEPNRDEGQRSFDVNQRT